MGVGGEQMAQSVARVRPPVGVVMAVAVFVSGLVAMVVCVVMVMRVVVPVAHVGPLPVSREWTWDAHDAIMCV